MPGRRPSGSSRSLSARSLLLVAALAAGGLLRAAPAFAQAQTIAPPALPQGKQRVDVGFSYEALTRGHKDQAQLSARWTTRETKLSGLFVQFDQHNRQGNQDARVSVGGIHNVGEKYTLWADVAFSPNADLIADRAYDVGGSAMLSPKTMVIAQYSRYHYPGGIALNLVIPGVLYIAHPKVMFMGQYIGTRVFGDAQNSGLFTVMVSPSPRLTLNLVGGAGSEHYIAFTEGEVRRNASVASFTASAQWHLPKNRGLTTTYGFQRRSAFYATNTFTVSYSLEFR